MITLFLILCYFILIFNIIIPSLSEKMRRERAAYVNYKRLNKNFICVDDRLFSYNFTTSGIKAKVAVDNKNIPIPCSKINEVNNNKDVATLYCDKDREDIPGFARSCYRAYSDLFFTT
ncbi:imv membrane protein [Skunkpox virus]|uniref:Imv membrane protein n=1 Tax=Skunkpox virus TaxID=160796 RepID=A0A1C9KBV3_9POXV|nr:imv membrane protein [Skunkpox virus]AOP31618.1 imv membrane protein [Skunkpox virus]